MKTMVNQTEPTRAMQASRKHSTCFCALLLRVLGFAALVSVAALLAMKSTAFPYQAANTRQVRGTIYVSTSMKAGGPKRLLVQLIGHPSRVMAPSWREKTRRRDTPDLVRAGWGAEHLRAQVPGYSGMIWARSCRGKRKELDLIWYRQKTMETSSQMI